MERYLSQLEACKQVNALVMFDKHALIEQSTNLIKISEDREIEQERAHVASMVKMFTGERDKFMRRLKKKDERIGELEAENDSKAD